ncbi:Iojap [Chlamydia pneumoniae TW-183]|uniref:Ribosomal silencing factor RsfS n=2 Tax=Chlamydia pneumoniae TaxID=83558 RepID=Q9Z6Z1_CHLPN|nr:ribosome silencing factor [Chlamydia pneumoniae]AAD19053.1 IojAP superfamily ortholog [Chlamydia pneumoniae CWL029]AAF73719.1 iojap-related protein [Chlamydia pneumoniae AR39]AAP98876.1 Iojap [Chlamydia pneumoniae TW-183]ACZ32803.1 iojap-like protein [Chlamydia pneumoniae LPCoLN]ETR79688.1 Iojap protein [Chlamydia pneumoniae B21]
MDSFCFDLLKVAAKAIDDKKGNNLVVLDVRTISEFTDYFVFVEGSVNVHVKALANTIVEELKKQKVSPLHVEGITDGNWVVIDYGFIVVHVFVSEIRGKYRLEELWKDGFIVTSKLLAS